MEKEGGTERDKFIQPYALFNTGHYVIDESELAFSLASSRPGVVAHSRQYGLVD